MVTGPQGARAAGLDASTAAALFTGAGLPAPDAETWALLESVVAEGAAAHPRVVVPAAAFAAHVVARLPRDLTPVDALAGVRAADLYLACACSLRDPAALAVFEATFGAEFRVVLSRSRGQKVIDEADFAQLCRERLFAAERPKIADYAGQGDLRNWLRVTLVRVLVDLSRKRREVVGSGDEQALKLPAVGSDPELDYLKRLYQAEFKQAFEETAGSLSAEDRNLLRYHYAHGLGIDELGALLHVHRATAARRIAKARSDLLTGTKRRLTERLRLGEGELDSVMRMIESNVQVSLQRILG